MSLSSHLYPQCCSLNIHCAGLLNSCSDDYPFYVVILDVMCGCLLLFMCTVMKSLFYPINWFLHRNFQDYLLCLPLWSKQLKTVMCCSDISVLAVYLSALSVPPVFVLWRSCTVSKCLTCLQLESVLTDFFFLFYFSLLLSSSCLPLESDVHQVHKG